MSLRLRLFVAVVLSAIPLVMLLTWLRVQLDYRADVDLLYEFVVTRMEQGGRAACEAEPERFPPRPGPARGGPPRPGRGPGGPPGGRRPPEPRSEIPSVELFAYYPDFHSANPRAPTFPEHLRRALEEGSDRADERFETSECRGIRLATRMSWDDGPCAIMLATRRGLDPPWLNRHHILTAIALVIGLLCAVLLATGPVVGRVRRLTSEIGRAASGHYATPVSLRGRDEVGRLAEAFNAAGAEVRRHLEALQEREQALRNFVANTSHDVMIPLTVLQGHLSALSQARGTLDPEVVRDAMEELQYTTALIQNLSTAAKLEAGEPALQKIPVDLNDLVERVAARHAPIARQKNVELQHATPEDPVVVQGDPTLLEQALSNLVHNAVRYNESGGHAVVILDAGDAPFRLRVIDDGPGIPDDVMTRITERAFRGDAARSRHPGGQGLGLHIASEVARRHGFELELRRSEHGGLEVQLRGPGGARSSD